MVFGRCATVRPMPGPTARTAESGFRSDTGWGRRLGPSQPVLERRPATRSSGATVRRRPGALPHLAKTLRPELFMARPCLLYAQQALVDQLVPSSPVEAQPAHLRVTEGTGFLVVSRVAEH